MAQTPVELIKSLGFAVYMRNLSDSYCYYSDGQHIGYVQWSRLAVRVSSVHRGNTQSGAGFIVEDDITEQGLRAALALHTPHWAARDSGSVKKYRNWDAFHKANAWNSGFFQV